MPLSLWRDVFFLNNGLAILNKAILFRLCSACVPPLTCWYHWFVPLVPPVPPGERPIMRVCMRVRAHVRVYVRVRVFLSLLPEHCR